MAALAAAPLSTFRGVTMLLPEELVAAALLALPLALSSPLVLDRERDLDLMR
jgi:hypothetical protein